MKLCKLSLFIQNLFTPLPEYLNIEHGSFICVKHLARKTRWKYKNHVTRQCNIHVAVLPIQTTRIASCSERSIRPYVRPSIALSLHCSSLTANGSQADPFPLRAFRHFHHFVTRNVRQCHFHRTYGER